MATRLDKSEPSKLAFRLNPPGAGGATLQVAQDFTVTVDVQFGGMPHANYRAGEPGRMLAPEESRLPGTRFSVLAGRDGPHQRPRLIVVPEAEADYYFGLPIGGFTIGEDGHPDPASAWDLDIDAPSAPALPHQLVETGGRGAGVIVERAQLDQDRPEGDGQHPADDGAQPRQAEQQGTHPAPAAPAHQRGDRERDRHQAQQDRHVADRLTNPSHPGSPSFSPKTQR